MNARELEEKPRKPNQGTKKRLFSLRRYIKTPKGYAFLLLLILTLLSFTDIRNSQGVYNLFAAVLTTVFIDILAAIIQKRKPSFPDGALITGLIVAVILSADTLWSIVAITSGLLLCQSMY